MEYQADQICRMQYLKDVLLLDLILEDHFLGLGVVGDVAGEADLVVENRPFLPLAGPLCGCKFWRGLR